MKKKWIFVIVASSLAIILIGVLAVYAMINAFNNITTGLTKMIDDMENTEWNINARELAKSLAEVEGEEVEDIREYIPFEWDTLYSFKPNTPIDTIYDVVGYKWEGIFGTTDESTNQIVFLKNGKVICYIYGDIKYTKVHFDFGELGNSQYLELSSENELPFKIEKDKSSSDTVRVYLTYTGEVE